MELETTECGGNLTTTQRLCDQLCVALTSQGTQRTQHGASHTGQIATTVSDCADGIDTHRYVCLCMASSAHSVNTGFLELAGRPTLRLDGPVNCLSALVDTLS